MRRRTWLVLIAAFCVAAVCILGAAYIAMPAYVEHYGYDEPRVVSAVNGRPPEAVKTAKATTLSICATTSEELDARIALKPDWVVVERYEKRFSLHPYCAELVFVAGH